MKFDWSKNDYRFSKMIECGVIGVAALAALFTAANSRPLAPGEYTPEVHHPDVVAASPKPVHTEDDYIAGSHHAITARYFLKEQLLNSLRDPDSAKIEDEDVYVQVVTVNGGTSEVIYALCGTVNAKNGFGGYVGREPFVTVVSASDDGSATNIGGSFYESETNADQQLLFQAARPTFCHNEATNLTMQEKLSTDRSMVDMAKHVFPSSE
jgi:hypothetical protein